MPLYPCRWPNGGRSAVWAANNAEAIALLDGEANQRTCETSWFISDFPTGVRLST